MRLRAALLAAAVLAGPAGAADPASDVPRHTLRGQLTVKQDVAVFRSCGTSGRDYFLVDAAGGEVRAAYAELAGSPGQPVFMELHGVVLQGPASGPGAGLERMLRAESLVRAEKQGLGCRGAVGRIDAMALGSNPAWQAELSKAAVTFASLQQPGMLLFPPYAGPWPADGALRFEQRSEAGTLALTFTAERCRDAISGNLYALSALAVVNGATYRGCAYRGRSAAATAAAAPKTR